MISNRIAVPVNEVQELKEKCYEQMENGTKFRGMSYEDGILAVLDWLFGETNENPMDD